MDRQDLFKALLEKARNKVARLWKRVAPQFKQARRPFCRFALK